MQLTVEIDGQQYKYTDIQTYRTGTGGPGLSFVLTVEGKRLLTSTTEPNEVMAMDSAVVGDDTAVIDEDHPLYNVRTIGHRPDAMGRSYQTLPYDLYQVMPPLAAYQVLVTAYKRTNKRGTATRDIVEVAEAIRPDSEVSELQFDDTYDFERSTPPFGDDPTSIINSIHELSAKDKYWMMLPERLYHVASSDVARDILGIAANNIGTDGEAFIDELIAAIEEWCTDAQQSALGIDTAPSATL